MGGQKKGGKEVLCVHYIIYFDNRVLKSSRLSVWIGVLCVLSL